MTDRPTDDQIRQALMRRSPANSPEDLRMHILSTAAETSQVAVNRPRLRISQPTIRLVYLAALLALLAAVAVGTLSGGHENRSIILTADPSATPTPSPTPVTSPTPKPTPAPSAAATDEELAVAAVTTYEQALTARDFATAWNLLAPESRGGQTLASFSADRSAYLDSSKGRFQLKAPDHSPAAIEQWLTPGITDGIDKARTYVIEVDYPVLAGNNSGYDIFLASPDASGAWKLWDVR